MAGPRIPVDNAHFASYTRYKIVVIQS